MCKESMSISMHRYYTGTSNPWFVLPRQKGVKCWKPGSQVVGQSRVKVDSALVALWKRHLAKVWISRDHTRVEMSNCQWWACAWCFKTRQFSLDWMVFEGLWSCFIASGTKDKNGHWKGSIQPGGVYVHRLSKGVSLLRGSDSVGMSDNPTSTRHDQ